MKKIFNINTVLVLFAMIISGVFVIGVHRLSVSAAVPSSPLLATPFGGRIQTLEPCCNGIMFSLTPEKEEASPADDAQDPHAFFFEYDRYTPLPDLGFGMYRWWKPMIGNIVLGDATPVGICMAYTNCTTEIKTKWNVRKMATTLYPPAH